MRIRTVDQTRQGLGGDLLTKLDRLQVLIRKHRNVVVAFSGGVDSTFLAWAARETLGAANVFLITADSATYPSFERREAEEIAAELGLGWHLIHTGEMENPAFAANPPDRCYYCKSELFVSIIKIAQDKGYGGVFEGGNASDLSDFRPGRRAIAELGVVSPLCDAGLTKDDIRAVSAAAGLPTAAKPSYACLASRFPYGEAITDHKLRRVEAAEVAIRSMGFTQFRVRSHGDVARLEFIASEMDNAWSQRAAIADACRVAGYVYASIDLVGYRTGAMNEVLKGGGEEE